MRSAPAITFPWAAPGDILPAHLPFRRPPATLFGASRAVTLSVGINLMWRLGNPIVDQPYNPEFGLIGDAIAMLKKGQETIEAMSIRRDFSEARQATRSFNRS